MRDKPKLKSVYVVLADFDAYGFPREKVDLRAPPAAFTSLAQAKECLAFLCQELREDASAEWERMRACFAEGVTLDVYPEIDFSYCYRFQIVEILMARETMIDHKLTRSTSANGSSRRFLHIDEDLVQSLAFEELVQHTWCYNVDGKLLWESPSPSVEESGFDRYSFEGRFKVGDLVYVVPQGIEPESESIEGDLAAVSEVPVAKVAWLGAGNARADWNPYYTVNFVDQEYYLGHYHVPESSLMPVSLEIPKRLEFLGIWSRFLRGEIEFPDGLAERICARRVQLLRRPRFDFELGTIIG